MAEKQKTGKGGTRKHGRNLTRCAKYKALGRREKNKARKMKKQARFEAKKKAKREGGK